MFAYLLWPLAFVMGVPAPDCFKVAELIGVKTVLNELIAFQRLGEIDFSELYSLLLFYRILFAILLITYEYKLRNATCWHV